MRRVLCLLAASCCAWSAPAGSVWTETFDNGVGRFSVTTGDGHGVFVHDPATESLNATFIRRDGNNNSVSDRRLASLGATYGESDAVSFTFDWTPLSESGDWPADTSAFLGFFDSASNQLVMGTWILVGGNPNAYHYRIIAPGLGSNFQFSSWEFGNTYRVGFSIDGPGRTVGFSTSVLQGNEFVLQDSGVWPLPSSLAYSFGRVGMQNLLDGQFGSRLVADIDNFSFIPEPSTALMLGAGIALMLHRRRASSALGVLTEAKR